MTDDDMKVAVDAKVAEKVPSVVITPLKDAEDEEQRKQTLSAKVSATVIHFFADTIETLVVALSIFVVVYLFAVQPHEVKGLSMEPNFHNNEYILTDKFTYRFKKPERGQVVIFKAPTNPDVDYIKRIIGLPGDRVKVEGGYVYVNGTKLPEPYLADKTFLLPGSSLQEGVELVVPQDHYFMMGDNRPKSSDSREFGPVDKKLIVGKALFRYWPLTEFGLVPVATY